MKIGIIGAGNMGAALGKFWSRNGHQLMFSYAREADKLQALAASFTPAALTGSPAEAAQFGEVVVLAVPFWQIEDALKQAGSLAGKILFSIVNALKPDYSGLAIGTTTSAAEAIARLASGAHVVEGIPLFADVLQSDSRQFDGVTPSVFYCGDDAAAKEVVAGLLRETECEAIDAGLLTAARLIEPAMMLLVQMAYGQKAGQVAFKLLTR
jgi:predicted dinucleotide-binding enzyme